MTVEDLEPIGVERMDETEIGNFLSSQGVGILGLEGAEGPYLLPMSFGYDGDDRILFSYLVGEDSQKVMATERTETARFLVYSAESSYVWRSVILRGPIAEVSFEERDVLADAMGNAWRPEALARATDQDFSARNYELRIEDEVGLKHSGLPPGF